MSLRAALFSSALMCITGAAHADCTFEPRLPNDRYEFQGDQVLDKETKLTWQRCAVGQKWQDGLGCVGAPQQLRWPDVKTMKGGWRLPTKEELSTLLSDACLRSINTAAFPGVSLQYPSYWTSSETAPDLTWTIDLNNGNAFNAVRSSANAAMLVRGQAVAQASDAPRQNLAH